MSGEAKGGRNRGLSSPAAPLQRSSSLPSNNNNNNSTNNNNTNSSDSTKHQGISLSHSLSQITHFMSTSFPHRSNSSRKGEDKTAINPEVNILKEEFERKITAIVTCLQEKAEENIDLSRRLEALQAASKQKEAEKDRIIEELQKALKAKEEECVQLEKKGSDEVLNELNRRIQTITHCLNDMAEENLKLRTTVNANAVANTNGKAAAKNNSVRNSAPPASSPFSPPPANSATSFSADHETSSSASFLSNLTASSSILSVAKSTSSITSSHSAPSTPIKQPPPPTANAKQAPAAASSVSVSTSTSPPVAHTTLAPSSTSSTPTIPITLSSSANSVAEMKSEILAEEFLKDPEWLKKFSDTYLVPPPPSQSLNLLSDIIKQDKLRVEARVKVSLDERIKELETGLKEHETNVTTMKEKLDKEKDRTGSLTESVTEYEKKLKDLEGRMWDNLNKEAQRRTEAESKAKRLKKKVDELQFLLDELKDDGSDEDEDDDDQPAHDEHDNSTSTSESEESTDHNDASKSDS